MNSLAGVVVLHAKSGQDALGISEGLVIQSFLETPGDLVLQGIEHVVPFISGLIIYHVDSASEKNKRWSLV